MFEGLTPIFNQYWLAELQVISSCLICQDKINQWGPDFREGYTRLGLLRPFLAEGAPIFCLTATATGEDIRVKIMFPIFKPIQNSVLQVACDILTIKNDLNMNICSYRGIT